MFSDTVDEGGARTVVESYHDSGFIINGTLMQGAVMLLPSSQLLWNVSNLEDITWDSLVALRMLQKKPELCVFGTGRRMQRLDPKLVKELREIGINVELADTVNALATFNVLNEEGRRVAGCFIPLDPIELQVQALDAAVTAARNQAKAKERSLPHWPGVPGVKR
ncbi:NADH dehydrogenase 1 alpha subcomplex assembly factor 3 [Baffinella frigidus]|nr:NADH dehydrogenase 1 alpha subcomplex assembly factor 3 [Cryptophyta sp. CCMP2293]